MSGRFLLIKERAAESAILVRNQKCLSLKNLSKVKKCKEKKRWFGKEFASLTWAQARHKFLTESINSCTVPDKKKITE